MRRFLPMFTFLLLALWLPATEHCALEAAGLLAETCADGCATESAVHDGCATVESGTYKPATQFLKVAAPELFACACTLYLQQIEAAVAREQATPLKTDFARPQDWVATWRFVQRAAPPARAPTTLLA